MKVSKRFREQWEDFLYKGQQIPFSLGTLCVVMLCLLMLTVGTFTRLNICHHWFEFGGDEFLTIVLKKYSYVPQVPLVLFTAALLGGRFGLLTVILYLITGFFIFPVFAFGGGIGYIKSPVFGYILGYIPAVVFTGAILYKEKGYKGLALSAFFGVLIIHLCGLLYIGLLSLFGVVNFAFAFGNIMALGGAKILYDWVLSFLLMSFSNPLKCILWLAVKNSPPAQRAK